MVAVKKFTLHMCTDNAYTCTKMETYIHVHVHVHNTVHVVSNTITVLS